MARGPPRPDGRPGTFGKAREVATTGLFESVLDGRPGTFGKAYGEKMPLLPPARVQTTMAGGLANTIRA